MRISWPTQPTGAGAAVDQPVRSSAIPVSIDQLGRFLGTGLIPFALIVYLGLEGGGYDVIVRSQVGMAIWWLILFGALCGLLPVRRVSRSAWISLGAMAALVLWVGLSISWSDSSERSVAELARISTLGGVFVLALLVQGRDGLRRTLTAIAVAIGVIGLLALLSRLHPSWFPESESSEIQETARVRLSYPLNYWNGLAALIAMGIPLLVMLALRTRMVAGRAIAAAAIPALALAAYFTLSRGGALALLIGLIVLIALWPQRLAAIPTLVVVGIGSAILIIAATQRDALAHGLQNSTGIQQGNEMLAMTIFVTAGVAMLTASVAFASKYGLLRMPSPPSRRATALAFVITVLLAGIAATAAGLPNQASDSWEQFKEPHGALSTNTDRFTSASGSTRYQLWDAALAANSSDPLKGIGAGTYEYWWSSQGSLPTFVRDAHSLYLEVLAELGVIGLALLLGFLATLAVHGVRLVLRGDQRTRMLSAGALASMTAFLVGAGVDWSWEMTVLPAAFFLIAGALLAKGPGPRKEPSRGLGPRIGFAAVAAAALVMIAPPLGAATALRESQTAATDGNLNAALAYANDAADLQPYAASPQLQKALIFELQGNLDSAADAATDATEKERTNWRTWQVLSRIEAERSNANESLAAYREAKRLNPRSPLFNGN